MSITQSEYYLRDLTGQGRDIQYPQLLQVDEEFVSISAGYAHSLALTSKIL